MAYDPASFPGMYNPAQASRMGLFGGGAMPGAGAQQQPAPPGAAPAPGGLPPGVTPEMLQLFMASQKGKFQIPPELIKSAAQTSQQGLEVGQLDRQMKLADQLRADAGDQLKGVQAGRRFVAPGAANMIANLMGGMYGASMGNDVMARRKAMVGEGQAGVDQLLTQLK